MIPVDIYSRPMVASLQVDMRTVLFTFSAPKLAVCRFPSQVRALCID